MPEDELRALVFLSLIGVIIARILAIPSFGTTLRGVFGRIKPTMIVVLGAVFVVLALSLLRSVVRDVFRFRSLDADSRGLALGFGAAVLMVFELLRLLCREVPRSSDAQMIPDDR